MCTPLDWLLGIYWSSHHNLYPYVGSWVTGVIVVREELLGCAVIRQSLRTGIYIQRQRTLYSIWGQVKITSAKLNGANDCIPTDPAFLRNPYAFSRYTGLAFFPESFFFCPRMLVICTFFQRFYITNKQLRFFNVSQVGEGFRYCHDGRVHLKLRQDNFSCTEPMRGWHLAPLYTSSAESLLCHLVIPFWRPHVGVFSLVASLSIGGVGFACFSRIIESLDL